MRTLRHIALCALLALAAPAIAQADVTLKVGQQVATNGVVCFPEFVTPAYSQQSAGVEPRVGDVFYLSVRIDFTSSFDCAADFMTELVTLPTNVAPVASLPPICRRFGRNAAGATVYDQRATGNCPTAVAFDPTTRSFHIGPRPGAVLPDFGPPSSTWFIGYHAPNEHQEYDSLQLLVPVIATSTVSGGSISYFTCGAGTSCVNATVPLTVTPGPAPNAPPAVSLPGGATTSADGAKVPFSVSAGASQQYRFTIETATSATFAGGWPCGTGPYLYPDAYVGPLASNIEYGSLTTPGHSPCPVRPNTTYHVRVCLLTNTAPPLPYPGSVCRTTQFTTGVVAGSAADHTRPTVTLIVRGTVRRGRTITLRVNARDSSGVLRLVVKVAGKRRTLTRGRFVYRLPAKGRTLAIVITATDMAKNVTTLRRTLRVG
jgi:hypothetical protein